MSGWNLFTKLSTTLFGIMNETIEEDSQDQIYDSYRYAPSVEDVLAVKRVLTKKGTLPLELIDTIIDFAEYWVRTTTARTGGEIRVVAGDRRENKLLLRSYPLGYIPTAHNPTTLPIDVVDEYPSIPPTPWSEPGDFPHNATQEVIDSWTRQSLSRGEFPCRKIVFTIKSHDQGWGGPPGCRGTYKGSSTWFDVGLEKVCSFRDSQLPPSSLPKERVGFWKAREAEGKTLEHLYSQSGASALPCFRVSDPLSTSTDTAAIICSVRTISPPTVSLETVGDPPHTEYEFQHGLNPDMRCLQKNKTATRETTDYQITWSCEDNIDPDSLEGKKLDDQGRGRETGNGEYVRNLKVGDVVTVWGKARYGQWVNNIEEVKIDVYWAV